MPAHAMAGTRCARIFTHHMRGCSNAQVDVGVLDQLIHNALACMHIRRDVPYGGTQFLRTYFLL